MLDNVGGSMLQVIIGGILMGIGVIYMGIGCFDRKEKAKVSPQPLVEEADPEKGKPEPPKA